MKQPWLCFCFCKLGLPKERPCLWFCFGKAGETSLLKKREKSRERGFGCLCNLGLPKILRFSLQRHKTAKSCAFCDCTPVYSFAAFATLVCQRNCVSLCKGKKLKNSAKPNSWDCLPVLALELGTLFVGFGSQLLESNGFLGAKAGHSDQRFFRWKLLFYQQPYAKAKEFGEAEFWDCTPDFLWRNLVLALEKQGKLRF